MSSCVAEQISAIKGRSPIIFNYLWRHSVVITPHSTRWTFWRIGLTFLWWCWRRSWKLMNLKHGSRFLGVNKGSLTLVLLSHYLKETFLASSIEQAFSTGYRRFRLGLGSGISWHRLKILLLPVIAINATFESDNAATLLTLRKRLVLTKLK